MDQRALALDNVPMIRRRARRQRLRGARNEIRHNGVDRNPGTGDEDAGLARRAKIGVYGARPQAFCKGERGVLLTNRTIRAHRQQAFAGSRFPGTYGQWTVVVSQIDQSDTVPFRARHEFGNVREPAVHSARHVEPRIERALEQRHPTLREGSARAHRADDEGLRALSGSSFRRQFRYTEIRLTARHPALSEHAFRAPVDERIACFGSEPVMRFGQEDQVGGVYLHDSARG